MGDSGGYCTECMSDEFIIIGERLNSSSARVKDLFARRDTDAVRKLAKRQLDAGAKYIDVNASMLMDDEPATLRWVADIVLNELDGQISVDSADHSLLITLSKEFGERAILNSVACDEDILKEVLETAGKTGSKVIVILKDREGLPKTVSKRIELCKRVERVLADVGFDEENIFVDPVVTPVATSINGANLFIESLLEITKLFPRYRTVCGVSNVSFGLPDRKALNRTFLAMAIWAGLNSAICDPTDIGLVDTIFSAMALSGRDKNCMAYLKRYRLKR